jgi:hypothetical protein
MTVEVSRPVLKDMKALVVGIANEHFIAYGCARAFREPTGVASKYVLPMLKTAPICTKPLAAGATRRAPTGSSPGGAPFPNVCSGT